MSQGTQVAEAQSAHEIYHAPKRRIHHSQNIAKKRVIRISWRSFITVGVLFIIWEILSLNGTLGNRFPTLLEAATALGRLVSHGFAGRSLVYQIGVSVEQWIIGVAMAVVVGVVLGSAMAWWRSVRGIVAPAFEFLRYIPPLAWVPLAIIILGPSLKEEAFIVFVGATPPCLIGAWTAVGNVDEEIIEVSKVLGAGSLVGLVEVALPVAAGGVVAGIRIALANGWGALIGAELIGAQAGLGFVIITAEQSNSDNIILIAMVIIGIVGALIDLLFRKTTAKMFGWM